MFMIFPQFLKEVLDLPGAGNLCAWRQKIKLISAVPVNFLIKSHLQISKPGIIFRSSSENDTF